MGNLSNLKRGLNELRERLQKNADAMASAIEKREQIYFASSSEVDIKKRLDHIVSIAADKFMRDRNTLLSVLTRPPSDDIGITIRHIFDMQKPGEGLDANAIAFYFKDALIKRNGDIAAQTVKPCAGLPAEERELIIKELDEEILKLETELVELKKQAKDAGLIVTEEAVSQPMPKPKKEVVQKEPTPPIKVNGSCHDESPERHSRRGWDISGLSRHNSRYPWD